MRGGRCRPLSCADKSNSSEKLVEDICPPQVRHVLELSREEVEGWGMAEGGWWWFRTEESDRRGYCDQKFRRPWLAVVRTNQDGGSDGHILLEVTSVCKYRRVCVLDIITISRFGLQPRKLS